LTTMQSFLGAVHGQNLAEELPRQREARD
jgi:hypothetical protein